MRAVAVCAASLALGVATAATIDQPITLQSGWNAVYVSVGPTNSADEVFAGWPVKTVSAYNAQMFRVTADTSGGLTGEATALSPFLVWTRESHANTLRRLAADTVLVCENTNATAFTTTLRGIPAAPRIAWHASGADATYNYVGVRLANQGDTIAANDYFAGCPALASKTAYCVVATAADGSEAIIAQSGAFPRMSATSATLSDGAVLLVPGTGISDWSGPLYVSPRAGIDFGSEATQDELVVRNDGTTEKLVKIEYVTSTDGMAKPDLLYRENSTEYYTSEWNSMTNGAISRILSTGETWTVTFALDRTRLAGTGADIGGVLCIREASPSFAGYTGFCANVPVDAKDAKTASVWPQGLWCVQAKLDKVTWWKNDIAKVDDVAAGGTMPVKFFVHVDTNGVTRLMQRVILAGRNLEDGSITESLYGPDAAIPTGHDYVRRYSSAMLPVDLGVVTPEGGAAFGDADAPLVFSYTIAAESPSNPFRHALHPLFDNKQMDFKTPAPSGDNITNYVGSVKPELFSIGGRVTLSFDQNAAASWSPSERLTGNCTWTYSGIRRQGDVTASGTFSARRIVKTAEIALE